MKKNKLFNAGILLLFLFPAILGCKKITTDNLVLNVDTDVFSAPTMLSFENAKEGASNQPLEFSLTISGPDKDKIISGLGTQKFDVHDGWIALNLVKGVEPSLQNPIRFVVSGKLNGFEEIRKEITLVSKDELSVAVKVIETGNLPSGITEVSKSFKLNAGVFDVSEVLMTSPENGTNETAKLTLNTGTKFRDKDQNFISGDLLTADVRYYGTSDASVSVFPGGLSPQNVLDKNGKSIAGGVNFFTAGLVDIDMSIGGKDVKYFDKPVDVEMKLNPEQDNFLTGAKVKAGDSIPVWSLDEVTGQWKEEQKAVIVETVTGLTAKFAVKHLSAWNLDWGWSYFGSYGDAGGALDVTFSAPWSNATGNYEVTLRSPNGGYLGALHNTTIFNGFVARFERTPSIPLAYIEIRDNETGKVVFESEKFNPGTKGSLAIKMGELTGPEYIDVSLTYALICTKNPKVKPNSSTWISIKDLETNKSQRYYTGKTSNKTTKGRLDIRLVNGRKYKVSTIGIDGKLISCESIFNVNNLQYQNVKGLTVKKLIYDPAVKKVYIDCEYTTDKC